VLLGRNKNVSGSKKEKDDFGLGMVFCNEPVHPFEGGLLEQMVGPTKDIYPISNPLPNNNR